MSADRYIALMTSLPFLGELFKTRQTPMSRLRLENHLRMLVPEDFNTLRRIEAVLSWSGPVGRQADDEILVRAAALVAELPGDLLPELVGYRLELRTLIAALRLRRRGEGAPDPRSRWGFGRWLGHMGRHWSEPGLGMQGVFPWITEASRLLEVEDSLGLERLILARLWERLGRFGEGHYFDFEAVVIYVMRWDIIDRWAGYSGAEAVQRFRALVEAGLGEYGGADPGFGV